MPKFEKVKPFLPSFSALHRFFSFIRLSFIPASAQSTAAAGDAIEVLDDLAKGNLEAQVEKQRDDEIGKIADALNVFKERINAFNHMQRDAREKKISQQGEILSQTQALARLLPVSRRQSMDSTIRELEAEIEKLRAQRPNQASQSKRTM